jgi:SAM-dependent methyltransferase
MITADEVVWAYRILFDRDPENADVIRDHMPQASLASLVRACLESPEFRSRHSFLFAGTGAQSRYPLDGAPPIHVQSSVSADDQAGMWARIARSWDSFGQSDPYWSVLVDERWRLDRMSDAAALDAFYRTGRDDLDRLDAWLARGDMAPDSGGVCAEYGCGVGRVTEHLARRFRKVRAFDISASHLQAAQQRLHGQGLTNVEFVLVRGPADLHALAGCDLFFSIIVLQHNPPPVIRSILQCAAAGLRPNGIAYFQLPTYRTGYAFDAAGYLQAAPDQAEIEMHCLPQRDVLDLLLAANCVPVEIQPDDRIGHPETWLSHTFLARKRQFVV